MEMKISNVIKNLKTPPREFSPVPIWWWSAEEITEERLEFQMTKMTEGGIYNAMIMNVAPTAPLYGKDMDNPTYMSERWWELFEFTCQTAKKLGMFIWFYDQIGFSGANFQGQIVKKIPEYAGLKLDSLVIETEGVQELTSPVDTVLLGAYAKDEEGSEYTFIPVRDGKIITKNGKQRIRIAFYQKAGFDYFSTKACEVLLDRIHGEFDRHCKQWYGDVLVGSFQDELPAMPTWGNDFADKFKEMKGYDIIPRLGYLWEGEGLQAEETRRDYQDVRAKLSEKAFFIPFFNWHRERNLACGIDQGGLARGGHTVDAIYYYADYIRTQRWYDIPGSDLMGNSKIHSSIANTCDRKRVWLEAFHSTGWGGSLEETFDWLLPWYRAGANLYNPHGFYYSTKGGFWEWAPPSTCWRQPYWKHYKQFADTISRMSYLLTGGTHICNIAVLYPTSAAQSHYTLDYATVGMNGMGKVSKKIQKVYEDIIGASNWFENPRAGVLDDTGKDFDIVSEFMVEDGQIDEKGLTIGNLNYKMIVLPNCTTVTKEAAKALCDFVGKGGILAAVATIPYGLEKDSKEIFAKLHQFFVTGQAIFVETSEELRPTLEKIGQPVVEAPVATLHRKKEKQNILFVPATKLQASENCTGNIIAPDKHGYQFSPDNYIKDMRVILKNTSSSVYQMNLVTGEVAPAIFESQGDDTEVTILFYDAPAVILLWEDEDKEKAVSAKAVESQVVQSLESIWNYTMVQTMQNRYGDFTKPNCEGAPAPATWFFGHKIGDDTKMYTCVQATFGQQAWMIKGKTEELPGALTETSPEQIRKSVQGWEPVIYSKTRGIAKDPIHAGTLGPSGHIPEEYMLFGMLTKGNGAQVRTGVWCDKAEELYLGVGGNCKKRIWVNGIEITSETAAYLNVVPVSFQVGLNILDLQYIAEKEGFVRGYWSVIDNAEDFVRPEWLKTDDEPEIHSKYRFTYEFALDKLPEHTDISYAGTNSFCSFRINGVEQDRMGGFKPYDAGTENGISHYNDWVVGKNEIEFEITIKSKGSSIIDNSEEDLSENFAKGMKANVFFDGMLYFGDGTSLSIISGEGWKVTDHKGITNNAIMDPYAITGGFGSNVNPALFFIKRRPCTLPGFEWLEEEKCDIMCRDINTDPYFGEQRVEWLSWKIPSTASKAKIDVAGEVELWLDGVYCLVKNGEAIFPGTDKCYYDATLRVLPEKGRTGGAILNGPVTYETEHVGKLSIGDWSDQGLESYSGGICYHQTVSLVKEQDGNYILNLGKVRGTAEVSINGIMVGIRFLSPYRFDITDYLKDGENVIAVTVFNTLAPYMNGAGATRFVPKQQLISGMFGEVRIELEN